MIYELLAVELIKFDIKNNVGYEEAGTPPGECSNMSVNYQVSP